MNKKSLLQFSSHVSVVATTVIFLSMIIFFLVIFSDITDVQATDYIIWGGVGFMFAFIIDVLMGIIFSYGIGERIQKAQYAFAEKVIVLAQLFIIAGVVANITFLILVPFALVSFLIFIFIPSATPHFSVPLQILLVTSAIYFPLSVMIRKIFGKKLGKVVAKSLHELDTSESDLTIQYMIASIDKKGKSYESIIHFSEINEIAEMTLPEAEDYMRSVASFNPDYIIENAKAYTKIVKGERPRVFFDLRAFNGKYIRIEGENIVYLLTISPENLYRIESQLQKTGKYASI